MKKCFLFLVFFSFCLCLKGEIIKNVSVDKQQIKAGEETIKIEVMVSQAKDIRISVWKEGKMIRAIRNETAESIKFSTLWNGKDQKGGSVKPGKYIIKIEADEQLILDKTFGENGVISDFVSPFTVKVAPDGNIWVLDKGEKFLCKFDRNGKPKNDIENENKLKLGEGNITIKNFVFDKDGFIYISNGWHQIYKMNQKGSILMKYGGFKEIEEDGKRKHTPETTTWCQVIGLGPDNKLYIWSYDGISVYNRGFSDFGGYLYKIGGVLPTNIPTADYTGPSGISNEDTGEIYWLNFGGWERYSSYLIKFIDTGEELKRLYVYGPLSTSPGIGTNWFGEIYVANWKDNRIEKLFDTGGEFKFVKSMGCPGKNIENMEFLGLHDIYIDGDYIYIVEDGERLYNYETKKALDEPGNHRVSRWIKKFKEVKEIEVEVKE